MADRLLCLVGFSALHRTILANVVSLFRAKKRIAEWTVAESWLPGATILVCDIDTAEGRHAWEWCVANGVARVAFTAATLENEGDVIPKPLRAAELQALIEILNRTAITVAPAAKPQEPEPEAAVVEKPVAPPAAAAPIAIQPVVSDSAQGPKDSRPSLRLAWSQPEPASVPPPPPANVVHFSSAGGMVGSQIVVQGTSHRVVVYDQQLEEESNPAATITAPVPQCLAEPEARIHQPVIEPPPQPVPAAPLPSVQLEPAPAAAVAPLANEAELPPSFCAATLPDLESAPVIDLPGFDPRDFLRPDPNVAQETVQQPDQSAPRAAAPIVPDVAFEAFVPAAKIGQFKEAPRVVVADDDRIRMILQGLKSAENPAAKAEEEDLTSVLARLRSIRKAAVLYFDGIEPICVAAVENQFYTKAGLREIYEALSRQSGPARTVVAETVTSGARAAGCYSEPPQNIKQLEWIAALRSRAPDVAQFEGRAYKLRQWPDLVQLPHDLRHMQWCGLLTRRPVTPPALADVNGASPQDVAAFLTACGELGILERTTITAEAAAKVEEVKTEKARERVTIFRSLLGRLGFGQS